MAAFTCSECEVFGPLSSKSHPSDTHAGPLEWLVVSAGLNWARTRSKFLKNNLSDRCYSDPYVRGVTSKEASASLV